MINCTYISLCVLHSQWWAHIFNSTLMIKTYYCKTSRHYLLPCNAMMCRFSYNSDLFIIHLTDHFHSIYQSVYKTRAFLFWQSCSYVLIIHSKVTFSASPTQKWTPHTSQLFKKDSCGLQSAYNAGLAKETGVPRGDPWSTGGTCKHHVQERHVTIDS